MSEPVLYTGTSAVRADSADTLLIGSYHVNRLGYGAMRITGRGVWGEPEDRAEAIRVLRRAVELGVNFIDTADAYGPNVSEELIAEALHPYDGIIIGTKGGYERNGPGQWRANGQPAHLRAACEASLRRLKVEPINLYQLHAVDSAVPLQDSLGALVQLQKEGKIRYIGLSNVTLEQLEQSRKQAKIVSVQNRYNVFDREHEAVLRHCAKENIAFIPYFPIGGDGTSLADAQIQEIAKKHHASERQIALAWLLQHAPVTLPIPGTSSLDHLEENMAAASIHLSDSDMAVLDTLGN